ncbi:insulinase family protein [Salinicola salarius]|uniref:insulinase family protein n=1 Tax=Salinicola salarius TaxID=430457 RepID=UPI0026F021ED|nr:insulinase family protein [Salinicola salarius]
MQEPHSRASSHRAHPTGIAMTRRFGLRAWFAAGYLTLGLALAFSSLPSEAIAAAKPVSPDPVQPIQGSPAQSPLIQSPLIQSPNDDRQYRAITLDNGLQALLVSDPDADKAAAAMDVSVGSDNDPSDMPGLAHFLEHMLFLGTEGYPDPDGYQRFINRNGGSHNAFTADQDTNYFFDVDPEAFPEALDRFSQFFVSPQFNPEYVDRERHAVNSEYQARREDDARRINEALGKALNPDHPINHFSVGSLDTLNSDKRPLRQALLDFYHRHYGANVMQLAVLAPEPLDAIEQQVRQRFDAVPDRDLKKPIVEQPLARDGDLPASLRIQTNEARRQLEFLFPVDDPILEYANKPDDYLANLLGHEGEGSLLAALRQAGWADGLSAGTSHGDGRHALFDISISLTPEGEKHLDDIQASLFEQIRRIQDHGVNAWRYEEQARLAEQSFRFQQRSEPIDTVSGMAMSLAHYPLKDVQYAPYRMDQFDAAAIDDILERLTPDNLLRVYSGPDVAGEKTTEYFSTPYTLTRRDDWPRGTPLDGLALPEANPYIAEDLSVQPFDSAEPARLVDSPSVEIWHQADSDFGAPRVEWRFSLQNPDATRDARHAVLTRLLAGWLNDGLNERFYPASLAGQSFTAYAHGRGITLAFSGWRDHQDRLMQTVVEQLRQGEITDASIARVKQGLERSWENAPQDALYQQMQRTLGEALMRPQISTPNMLAAIGDIDAQDVRDYRRQFLDELYVQALAVGNLDANLARREGLLVANALSPRLHASDIPPLSVLDVPADAPALHPATTRDDAAVLRYLQGPDRALQNQASLAVIGQLIGPPFFAKLRTDEQLGYVVSAGYAPFMNAPGLMMLVQSPSVSSETIGQRMNAFLKTFDQRIEALSDADLAPYRQAVRQQLLQRDQSLSARADRLWQTLAYPQADFDRRQQLAAQVDELSAADVRSAWQTLRQSPTLSVTSDAGDQPSDVDALTRDYATLAQ